MSAGPGVRTRAELWRDLAQQAWNHAAAAADRVGALGGSALVVDAAGRLLGRAGAADLRRAGGTAGAAAQPCAHVNAAATVKQALPVVAAEAEAVAVIDDDGVLRGTIDRAGIIDALARRTHASQSFTADAASAPRTDMAPAS